MRIPEFLLVVILRVIGVSALFAIPFIFFPYGWMNAIHEYLGLGDMPNTPIVSYLARSLSMFYAILGAISLLASLDIRHYASLIRLLGVVWVVGGGVLLFIAWYSAMPITWTIGDGPVTMVVGLVVLWLLRRLSKGIQS
jgi:hypothetical protein